MKRIIVYTLLLAFGFACFKLNLYFKEEARIYGKMDSCGVKGCIYDLRNKTHELFLKKELAKNGITSFEVLESSSAMRPIKSVISFKENGIKKEKIVWMEPGKNYVWRIVFFGDDDTDFFKSINENL